MITTEAALELAGKAEIDRLYGVITSAVSAMEDGRRGDALKLLQTEARKRRTVPVNIPPIPPGKASA